MKVFDATSMALVGPRLVEASAGTGKTHAITTLVVRTIVERGIPIESILVVTFTEAATAELRTRIRMRLRIACRAANDEAIDDPEIAAIVKRHPEARTRLAVALTNVDRAAVFTIHGFCHRTLLDSAFDSGARFDVELLTDTLALRDEVLLDFWTDRLVRADEAVVHSLRTTKVNPTSLAKLVGQVTRAPNMPVLPTEVIGSPTPSVAPFEQAFVKASALWDVDSIKGLLVESMALHGGKYRKNSIPSWCDDIHGLVAADGLPRPDDMDQKWRKLTPAALADGVKKGYEGREPQHPFFDAWRDVMDCADAYRAASSRHALGFQQDLVAYARQELPRRKDRLGVMGFDDLLVELQRALQRVAGPRLAAAVRARYPVALIDEFQDTDPTQWEIFRTIYGAGDLVLIGDPKQAIYAFRGADVFAYLAAADHIDEGSQFTMNVSWRSDPGLLAAVDALYAGVSVPFAIEAIRHVSVGPRPNAEDVLVGAAPFEILFVRRPGKARIPANDVAQHLPHAIADHIQRLLQSDTTIEGQPVEAADVAVLTRTNKQAFEMQRALGRLGVHSVVLGDQSVFEEEQPEARELSLVLTAIAEPTNNTAIRSALTTELLGQRAGDLAEMESNEEAWDLWVDRFRRLSELWHGRGFIQMFRALMRTTEMVERLLGLDRGERRVTNLLHLMELLQTAASTQHLGPAALLAWLTANRQPETAKDRPEAAQIRLESDAHAVRITTVHRSKGLEYPVVYCPHLWDGTLLFANEKKKVTFHDEADGLLKLDLAGDPEAVERAEHERFAENLRLAYVALTRAKHRCVVVWGALGNSYQTSPLGYLLHAPPLTTATPTVSEVKSHISTLDDARMRSDIEARMRDTMVVSELRLDAAGTGAPEAVDDPPRLRSRAVKSTIRTTWRTASFSELTADKHGAHLGLAEGRDRDAQAMRDEVLLTTPDQGAEPITLAAFPRGAKAGDFFHDVFEHLDFTDTAALQPLVEDRLRAHGFAPSHLDDVMRAIVEVLDAQLPTGLSRGMRLRDVARSDRLDELEFYFPVANPAVRLVPRGAQLSLSFGGGQESAMSRLTTRALSQPFAEFPSPELEPDYAKRVEQLGFIPLEGYLKGYIDLVFQSRGRWYVVDYKSNHLGDTVADYGAASLRHAMSRGHYYLQAHLYAVAVHRLLTRRQPGYRYDRHFGGVLYLFIKGMRPGADTGIFFERPPRGRIQQLSDILDMPPGGHR